MEIKLLVTTSINCKLFERRVLEAVETKGIYAEIVKIEHPLDARKFGVIYMPALVVNGRVVSSGKLLSKEEILRLIFI